mmetsp:Transcript_29504/g.41525  ORF Transcript_29504/g.41525 Transcript_29504/m.41525 type:complete len:421 (+) Transcript_29504:60-1322(+)
MKRAASFEAATDEDFILEEIYEDVDFDFDLKEVHSDASNLLQSFIKREVVKSALKKQFNKISSASTKIVNKTEVVKSLLDKRRSLSTGNFKRILTNKKKQLETKIQTPPFLRTSDKVAFTLGIAVLIITEFIVLLRPEVMYMWYTSLLVPLLVTRYYTYKKAKWHYFMLDFCYFAQVLLLIFLFFIPDNPHWFQVVFSLSNGPLASGVVMWRNSMVFHDLDKLTSVFIHFFPPLVTFCVRWFPQKHSRISSLSVCIDEECSVSYFNIFVLTMVFYSIWQVLYLLKTEVLDKRKLEKDKDIITSARWLSQIRPHPVWKFFLSKGCKPQHAPLVLAGVQFVYTILTLIPILLIYKSFEFHVLYLSLVLLVCIWNGANFYFEIFSETYSERLHRFIKDTEKMQREEVIPSDSNTESNGTQTKQ